MPGKKRVLILELILENPAGRVGAFLDEYETFYHLIHVGRDHLPDPTRYDAIVVLGGSAHLYDTHKYPYSVHEEAYLHQAIKQGVPYLGMCLGGQLLAKAFGAEVKKLPKYHIGFLEIHFTEEGKKDPLYQGFESYQLAFQWHASSCRKGQFHWPITARDSISPSAMVNAPMDCSTTANSPKICSISGCMNLG